jgi:hypothetical protein
VVADLMVSGFSAVAVQKKRAVKSIKKLEKTNIEYRTRNNESSCGGQVSK